MLRLIRPMLEITHMTRVVADDFLQEQDVGADHSQTFASLRPEPRPEAS